MNAQLPLNISAPVPQSLVFVRISLSIEKKKATHQEMAAFSNPFTSALTCALLIGMPLHHSMSQNTLNIMTGIGLYQDFIIIVFCIRFRTGPAITDQGT